MLSQQTTDVRISGKWFDTPAPCVDMNKSSNHIVEGNRIHNCLYWGIDVRTSSSIVISNNH
ncbi:hypothetical protein D7M11_04910 [Paenibacillus ginsengarvi]|uniref:Uncharacterized protein n=1 Tax=Paenibacillus ginsengarvi TaxID=400777 RepID=A0A3B0CVH3_9BACL|nr:hypothetical protein D7M11_04910 [Paenibacillus ginsengarvi]